jgi:membrane associated rhomboid family serine protease
MRRTNFRGAFAGLVQGIPATVLLIAANVAVFAAMSAVDNRAGSSAGQAAYLVQWGANAGGLTFTGEPWRLVTSMFLHAGLLHLAFNCLALLEIGGVVERRLGAWRMLAIYLLAGLGGGYASARWYGFTVSVGASGAIFGLLGALIVFGYLSRRPLRGPYGTTVAPGRVLVFGVLTLALGLFFNFDNAAHLGGFAFGTLLSLAALLAEQVRRPAAALVFVLAVIATGAALANLTAQAFAPELAARVRFAQLTAALRAGDAGAHAILRRCALAAVGERGGTPAEAFIACLGETMPDNDAAPSRNDITNRYGVLLDHNRREVWPLCRRRAHRLLQQDLPETRRALVTTIARYCEARARIEASALADASGTALDAASLRQDLLHYELLDALVDRSAALPPAQLQQQPERAALQREADALARWRASIAPEEDELARLADCPFASCRRAWAR